GAFDEAIRQIISAGGRLPNTNANDGVFWSVNDNFCVPDSEYNELSNPDGKLKLAKLVQMCEALYEMATFFDIPLTSGKDSMKNDFKADGVKISVPPTILYSMTAKIDDVRRTITSEFKAEGDIVYQLGTTYNELGASEFYKLYNELGANVPKVRKEAAKDLYLNVMKANESRLIESSHDISDGGLAVALVESAFGGDFGVEVSLDSLGGLSVNEKLFSESHSRFVVSVRPENQASFESLFGSKAFLLGKVTNRKQIVVSTNNLKLIDLSTDALVEAWDGGLVL
ncbi:MAG: AIR synthase-related protein, partial [Saprospiraceae bacterium]|nr:AIR synthase-related protein [Saprospiraceae bacterium]